MIGLLLVGLGINKGMYVPNPNVRGDATVASQQVPPMRKNTFQLDPKNFEFRGPGKIASGPGIRRPDFDARAFGKGILTMQEDFAGRIEASREAARREFEDHKKELKQKLAAIKDTRKQALVEKLNTNCQNINVKRTTKMTEMLAKLSSILTNVTNRAAASGKDTSTVDTAVTAAQTAIADAQSAVATQAGKTCTITITIESNLKIDVGKVISAMQADLKSVYEKVITARKAVGDAVKTLALVLGEPLTPTPSPTTTP